MSELSIYTTLMIEEAKRRGITVLTYPELDHNIAVLQHESHQEFIYQSLTDHVGYATFKVAFNKLVSHHLLEKEGFPVPATIVTNDLAEAEKFLQQWKTVVIKPVGQSGGKGVMLDITTPDGIRRGFERATPLTRHIEQKVICQEQVMGQDYRLLVIGQKHVFGARRVPAHVIGDGQKTVRALVQDWNQKVPTNRAIQMDEEAEHLLSQRGYTFESVPKQDEQVFLTHIGNAHRGAIVHDTTDALPEAIKDTARAIARYFNCATLGIDVITPDITHSFGKIVELNPHAGIALHHQPTFGAARNVAGAILDSLFPETVKV